MNPALRFMNLFSNVVCASLASLCSKMSNSFSSIQNTLRLEAQHDAIRLKRHHECETNEGDGLFTTRSRNFCLTDLHERVMCKDAESFKCSIGRYQLQRSSTMTVPVAEEVDALSFTLSTLGWLNPLTPTSTLPQSL